MFDLSNFVSWILKLTWDYSRSTHSNQSDKSCLDRKNWRGHVRNVMQKWVSPTQKLNQNCSLSFLIGMKQFFPKNLTKIVLFHSWSEWNNFYIMLLGWERWFESLNWIRKTHHKKNVWFWYMLEWIILFRSVSDRGYWV